MTPIPAGIVASARVAAGGLPSGQIGWWDASDAATFTYSSGSVVQQWNDKSGNGYHLGQSNAAKRPQRDQVINGLAAVRFQKSAQQILVSGAVTSTPMPWSAWAVMRFATLDSSTQVAIGHFRGTLRVTGSNNLAADANAGFDLQAASTSTVFVASVFDAGTVTAYVNGTKYTGSPVSTTVPLTGLGLGANSFSFGSFNEGGNEWADVTICETGVYPTALSDAEFLQIRAYSTQKWGTP